jgi:hypothetical protein
VTSLRVVVRNVALIVLIAWPVPVTAAVVVVPNSLAAVEGGSAIAAGPDVRFQQVHGASQFAGLGVIEITGLALRPEAAFGPDTVPNLRVHLSTTAKAPDGLSTTFADNVGLDETIVFNGAWTRSSAAIPGPGGTRAFDIILPFTTSFIYDPAQGNLLMDFIDTNGFGSPSFFPLVDAYFAIGASSIAGGPNASTGFVVNGGVVTQFTFQPAVVPDPAAVPEPSSWILFGLGGAGLLTSVRRRRR